MLIDDFLQIIDKNFNDSYVQGICRSIIKIYNNQSMSYSIEDLKQDSIIYFITTKKYEKIQNINGARKSIINHLRDIYRKKKGSKKSEFYYKNFEFMPDEHYNKIKKCNFTQQDMQLHSFFYFDRPIKNLGIDYILTKNNNINIIKKIECLMDLLKKISDINIDNKIIGISKYLETRHRKCLDVDFIRISTKRTYIDYKKIYKYLKQKYITGVDEILLK